MRARLRGDEYLKNRPRVRQEQITAVLPYEDKEELLEDFLGFLLDEFETKVASISVNARKVAEFIYSTAYGAIERGVTLDDNFVLTDGRQAIDDYVDSQLRSYS